MLDMDSEFTFWILFVVMRAVNVNNGWTIDHRVVFRSRTGISGSNRVDKFYATASNKTKLVNRHMEVLV